MSTALLTHGPQGTTCRDIALEAYHRSPHGISAAMAGQRLEGSRGLSTRPVDGFPADDPDAGYRAALAALGRHRELVTRRPSDPTGEDFANMGRRFSLSTGEILQRVRTPYPPTYADVLQALADLRTRLLGGRSLDSHRPVDSDTSMLPVISCRDMTRKFFEMRFGSQAADRIAGTY